MTTLGSANDLALLRDVLEGADYIVDAVKLEGVGAALLAETPYALVAAIQARWEDLEERIAAAQASLTTVAAQHPSARQWDLYVVAVVPSTTSPSHEVVREAVVNNTRYARKFVVAGVGERESMERSVRALLPLRPVADIARIDALEAVRAGLAEQGVATALAEVALEAFTSTSEVRIP